jgi:hypothetical protein
LNWSKDSIAAGMLGKGMEGWVRGDEVEGWWWFGREGQGETREGSSRLGR